VRLADAARLANATFLRVHRFAGAEADSNPGCGDREREHCEE
jgi:hypothetical protein